MNTIRRTLVVAPYIGEFGWELMNWQGRVRWLTARGGFERVVVCARTDRRPLYGEVPGRVPVVFCPVPAFEMPGEANEDHRIWPDGRPVDSKLLRELVLEQIRSACEQGGVDLTDADLMVPGFRGRTWSTERSEQVFDTLRFSLTLTTDVLLVPRSRHSATERNRPLSWWEDLAARLTGGGLRVELYRAPLEESIRQLSRARLAAGASTGGLHLASLCRCPHYVWGSDGNARWTRWGMTNRQRYETVWNPLGTPCRYDECGWQPDAAYATDQIRRTLDEIGLTDSNAAGSWALRPAWRVKRGLARVLHPADGASPWPWRLRQLVRERLV